jgi:hypothetical protein
MLCSKRAAAYALRNLKIKVLRVTYTSEQQKKKKKKMKIYYTHTHTHTHTYVLTNVYYSVILLPHTRGPGNDVDARAESRLRFDGSIEFLGFFFFFSEVVWGEKKKTHNLYSHSRRAHV